MVKAARRICLLLFWALVTALPLAAKEPGDYRVGDKIEADIITPFALDVPDAVATAAQQSAAMEKLPAVFRDFSPAATNQLAKEFSTVLSVVRLKFRNALQKEFEAPVLEAEKLSAPEFTSFVENFIKANPRLPLNVSLATDWARGGNGAEVKDAWLARLNGAMQRLVCEELPQDFFPGENFYAVPVPRPEATLLLSDVEGGGHLVDSTNLMTVNRLRAGFRKSFADDEQALAAVLAGFLRPNCAPDLALTEAYRKQSAGHSVVMAHFEAGQTIGKQGTKVDQKTLAAIAVMQEKILMQKRAAQAALAAKTNAVPAKAAAESAKLPNYLGWVLSGVTGVIAFYFFLRATKTRRPAPATTSLTKPERPVVFVDLLDKRLKAQPPESVNQVLRSAPTPLAPQFVDALKEAVVTELASQRRDMLFAQQTAAAEIADLTRRLETAHAPLLERLRTYEDRIKELEGELADQTKQNRELLQMKIDMLKQQMEAERSGGNKSQGIYA